MVIRQVRIGSLENFHQYDDVAHPTAMNTDGRSIQIGPSGAPDEAVRQDQLPAAGDVVSSSGNIDDNVIVRGDGGAKGIQGSSSLLEDDGSPVLPKTSGIGIKVDTAGSVFGWRDLLGVIRTRGVGATDPNDAVYRGNIRQYQFAINDECWIEYHIPHDYVAGTDLHLHFHWSHIGTLVTGGNVTWGADISYAKGHNQAAFSAPVSPTVIGNASVTQYQHIITEVQISASTPGATQIDSDDLEPDGVILLRGFLSANNITVSGGGVPDPFLHFIDIHYQTTNIGTKNKSPNFYS